MLVGFTSIIMLTVVLLIGCTDTTPTSDISEQLRTASVQQRADNFERAVSRFRQPQQTNFPMREALVKYTERQDLLNHPWYIYLINECMQCPTGISYQYYVGQTYPQSTCNFLGSTEEVKHYEDNGGEDTWIKFQAPSLDGIYYGSGATTGGCDYFFFDAATDAMVVIHHDQKFNVTDRPLTLDAKLIRPE